MGHIGVTAPGKLVLFGEYAVLFGAPAVVAAIDRSGDWIVPHGDEEIRADDIVYFAIAREYLDDVVSLVGVKEERRRTVMVGGARISAPAAITRASSPSSRRSNEMFGWRFPSPA